MTMLSRLFLGFFTLQVSQGEELEPSIVLSCDEQWVISLALSPDGKTLVSGHDDGKVQKWSTGDLKQAPVNVMKFEKPATAISFDPDGQSVLLGTWDGNLVRAGLAKGLVQKNFEGHSETIITLRYDSSGDFFASGSADDTMIVWDAKTGEDLFTMHQGNEYDVTALAFSPVGESIVTGDGENQLKLWDARSGESVRTLVGHDQPVSAVMYDGKGRIVSGSWDKTIRVWGEGGRVMKGHKGEITGLSGDAGGKLIYSASEDRTVKIWDGETGKLLKSLSGSPESIRCFAVSRDGKVVYAGSKGVILVWRL